MSRISRRRFVGNSLAAAAALSAAPYIARGQNANEKLGAAVVGIGGRGGSHIGAFRGDSRTEVRYLVDIDEKIGQRRAEDIGDKQGFRPKVVRDMREAFDNKDIDIVGTATPNHWHALCGIWAMQAGKDVYIEKPICHDIAEGTALIAAARKYKRMCQTGTQCRSNAAIQNAVKFLAEGGIGEVKFARGLCYKRRKSIGPKGRLSDSSRGRFRSLVRPGHVHPAEAHPRQVSTTTGTGSGTTATATWATRGRTRPTSPGGGWASTATPAASSPTAAGWAIRPNATTPATSTPATPATPKCRSTTTATSASSLKPGACRSTIRPTIKSTSSSRAPGVTRSA